MPHRIEGRSHVEKDRWQILPSLEGEADLRAKPRELLRGAVTSSEAKLFISEKVEATYFLLQTHQS